MTESNTVRSSAYFGVPIKRKYLIIVMFRPIGQSKCPGETLTSRRESKVQIIQILPRCGATKNQICDESTLLAGQPALFGVVIQNLSPTRE